jgi:hypothetical protein
MSRNAYASWTMSDEYAEAVKHEQNAWPFDAPFGFDCLDAPWAIPAGSVESYEFITGTPGRFTSLPTCSLRFPA